MFTLFVRDTFAAAHRLELYHGKCEALHGHNFRVEVLIEGEDVGREGMLLDFAVLKAHLRTILADLDHKYINEIDFFAQRAASSEYMALYIYERLKKMLHDDGTAGEDGAAQGVAVKEVRVWESDNAYAAYGGRART